MNTRRNKELREALKNGRLFDYIGGNYYEYSGGELADIIKELIFLIYEEYGETESNLIENKLINAIYENTFIFSDEE